MTSTKKSQYREKWIDCGRCTHGVSHQEMQFKRQPNVNDNDHTHERRVVGHASVHPCLGY